MFSKYTKQILRLFKKMIDKIHNLLHINIHAHYFKSHLQICRDTRKSSLNYTTTVFIFEILSVFIFEILFWQETCTKLNN